MTPENASRLWGLLVFELLRNQQDWVVVTFFNREEATDGYVDKAFAGNPERRLWKLLDVVTECLIHPIEFAAKAKENFQGLVNGFEGVERRDANGERIPRLWATKEAEKYAAELRKQIDMIRDNYSEIDDAD